MSNFPDYEPVKALSEISEQMQARDKNGGGEGKDSFEDFGQWKDTVERGLGRRKTNSVGGSSTISRQGSLVASLSRPHITDQSTQSARPPSQSLHSRTQSLSRAVLCPVSTYRPAPRPNILVLKAKGQPIAPRAYPSPSSIPSMAVADSAFRPFPKLRRSESRTEYIGMLPAKLRIPRTLTRKRTSVTILRCIQTKETIPIHSTKSRMTNRYGDGGVRAGGRRGGGAITTRSVANSPSTRIASILIEN